MHFLQAIILGAVQGIGEFLPISSSAHLVIVPYLLKFTDPGLTFDVMLHLATAFALIAYFWRDFLTLEKKYYGYIVLGCIPAMIAGVLLEDYADSVFRNPLLIAGMLIIFALVLWYAEQKGAQKRNLKAITLRDALIIGLAQCLALVPGVSRAGITMTAGLFLGLQRETAARFSFLLATPIILGAGVLKLKHLLKVPGALTDPYLLLGFASAAIFGFLSIAFLLNFLKKHSFNWFVGYRILLGVGIILFYFFKH
jgi:undecaprenyl-diphosphatase